MMNKFLSTYYPILLAFACMLYSIGLHIIGDPEGAQYTAHWPDKEENHEFEYAYSRICNFFSLYYWTYIYD